MKFTVTALTDDFYAKIITYTDEIKAQDWAKMPSIIKHALDYSPGAIKAIEEQSLAQYLSKKKLTGYWFKGDHAEEFKDLPAELRIPTCTITVMESTGQGICGHHEFMWQGKITRACQIPQLLRYEAIEEEDEEVQEIEALLNFHEKLRNQMSSIFNLSKSKPDENKPIIN